MERTDLVRGLREMGVKPGVSLLVHSSLSSLGWVNGGEETVIEALLEVVGGAGLLAMPTHTWGTVNAAQPTFFECGTPSTVGRITETFRRRPFSCRSLHPTHSVAASGVGAPEFVAGHERSSTPCPPASPYGKLVERDGNVLLIGVGLERFTLLHAFEEWARVPWLFNRSEDLWSVTRRHEVIPVPSLRHTNDPRYETRDFPSLEPVLVENHAITYGHIGTATVRLVSARVAAECLVPLISADPDVVLGTRRRPRVGQDKDDPPGDALLRSGQ